MYNMRNAHSHKSQQVICICRWRRETHQFKYIELCIKKLALEIKILKTIKGFLFCTEKKLSKQNTFAEIKINV